MAKITVELTHAEFNMLKRLAKEQKRTPRAQAEWMLTDGLESWGKVWEESDKLREIFPQRGVVTEPSIPSDAEYSERVMEDLDHRREARPCT